MSVVTQADLTNKTPNPSSGYGATISKNAGASVFRVIAVSLVALLLPAYLTHHLPVSTYSAWILILQLAAYVSYLDLGIQMAVSKFVAEYDARGDHAGAGSHASSGFALMVSAGIVGLLLTAVLAWQVPRLFSVMPAALYRDVRSSVVLVGASLSFGLVCSVYSAVFLGLQRFWIPMTISVLNRAFFAGSVFAVVAFHGSLRTMGLAVALVNVVTGVLQIAAWRGKASHIGIAPRLVDRRAFRAVARYCTLQSISAIGMLFVTGLDITIVGHFDYGQTAYYSIATLPTTFVLLIIASMVSPLMPASSAMSTQRSPVEMGNFLLRTTRYTAGMLLLTGLPLIVCAYPILRLWVGGDYALHTFRYLRILVFANAIRNLCAPYAAILSAIGRQQAAILTVVAEAVVNLGASIYLASRFGAIGVAIGTVLGAVVSVTLHFARTMNFTRQQLAIDRWRLFAKGLVQPSVISLPSLVLLPLWWSPAPSQFSWQWIVSWGLCTIVVAWVVGLEKGEKVDLASFVRRRSLAALRP